MKKHFRIVVLDSIDTSGIDILESVAEVDLIPNLKEHEIMNIIPAYDALIVRSSTKITEKIIQCGTKLQVIGRAGVGIDNINVTAATTNGIFVVNSPEGNTVAAAEHTIGMILALSRNITVADASIRRGMWERQLYMGTELQHKTLGIIGLGQVGSHVAKIAQGFDMNLLVYDPYININKKESLHCRVVSLNDLLKESDFITIHIPLVPETSHLINAETLRLVKPTARIIHCSRGGIIDDNALCDALKEGRLAGAALDVFEVEGRMETTGKILTTPNLICTPHLGASTKEAQINVSIHVARQIVNILVGGVPDSAVNIPCVGAAELQKLKPLLDCCELLGKVAVQLLRAPLEQITLIAERDFSNGEKIDALLMAAANGAIGLHTASRVNFVNVKEIAKKYQIKMSLIKHIQATKNGVSVEVRSGEKTFLVRGTLTDDNEVLLTAFNNISVYMLLPLISKGIDNSCKTSTRKHETQAAEPEAKSEGRCNSDFNPRLTEMNTHFIYCRHEDVPGVLANITSIIESANINIANCHLGRHRASPDTRKGCTNKVLEAITILHVDESVSAELVDKLIKNPTIHDCGTFTI